MSEGVPEISRANTNGGESSEHWYSRTSSPYLDAFSSCARDSRSWGPAMVGALWRGEARCCPASLCPRVILKPVFKTLVTAYHRPSGRISRKQFRDFNKTFLCFSRHKQLDVCEPAFTHVSFQLVPAPRKGPVLIAQCRKHRNLQSRRTSFCEFMTSFRNFSVYLEKRRSCSNS